MRTTRLWLLGAVLCLHALPGWSAAQAPAAFARGVVVEDVSCAAQPGQRYALGLTDAARIEGEPAFKELRQEAEFRQIVARMTSPPGPLSHRPPADRERGNASGAAPQVSSVRAGGRSSSDKDTASSLSGPRGHGIAYVPPLPGEGGAMGEGDRG